MARKAVCVGINDYPGSSNDLNGCVHDAQDWATLLQEVFLFDPPGILLNAAATRTAILEALRALVTDAAAGDVLAFTYSGHGTWVYDHGERDESDNRDEAWCAVDGNIEDDELRTLVRMVPPTARLTIVSDSCHSGTITRARLAAMRAAEGMGEQRYAPKPRYMPPRSELDAVGAELYPIRRRLLYPESGMSELLLTGCNASEYSYDAHMNGRYNGAMTAFAIQLMRSRPGATYREFHKALRRLLPSSRYPQSPQLEGQDAFKDRPLFS